MNTSTNTSTNAQMNAEEMTHGSGTASQGKMAIEQLINSTNITHTAVRKGAWSDPKTWEGGRIPGKGANVLIGEGITVTYDKRSNEDIKTIAIRGKLRFATGKATELRVETIINAPEGRIRIGSKLNPVTASKQARIIFTSDSAVDTSWDPQQLTKGLISHGSVKIFGAKKKEKVRLARNASAGDDTLTFKDDLTGWRVGDKIVLAGTSYGYNKSDQTNERSRDEVLTIEKINGKTIWFTNDDASSDAEKTTLRFDHKKHSKLDANKIDLYAANLSRNVSFETENGKDVPVSHRAHVMLMHNPNVKVLNAGFYDLGRSDKTKLVDDVGQNVDGTKGYGTNPRGRYSLHLHQTGLDPKKPILLKGNAVSGSPGWGIVQHESHAGLEDNVVFDVAGAGIVAESGNETGWWERNIAIKATGIRWDIAQAQRENREKKFDLGFEGDGYWIQGAAQIANTDNVAISANHTGMSLFSGSLEVEEDFRPIETIAVKDLPAEMRALFPGLEEVDIRFVPTATVKGFESYNSNKGLEYWGHSTNFDGELGFSEPYVEGKTPTAHQGRSLITDFKTWGNRWDGISLQYSSNVDIKNGIVAGLDDDTRVSGGRGVFVNHGTYNSVVDRVEVNGFKEGFHFEQLPSDKSFNTNTLQNSKVSGSTYNLSKVADETLDNGRKDDFGAFVKLKNNQFEAKGSNRAPVARFSSKGVGGLGVELNAGSSFDPDPYVPGEGTPKPVESKGIAAYGWDVDNNGTLDYFGRTLTHTFSSPGSRTVGLTVLDAQGKATTLKKSIDVQPTDYGNAFKGGSFGADTPIQEQSWMDNSQWADKGWFVSPRGAQIADGIATLSKVGEWGQHLGQVVHNQGLHKGQQTLSFRLQNLEGSSDAETWKNNKVTVTLWGVNGQFENSGWDTSGPQKVGALPMQRTQLVSQNYGGETGAFFDWKSIKLNVDLGKGYDYLLFQVNTERSSDIGDRIAIDNVSLSGKANTAIAQTTTLAVTASDESSIKPQAPTELSPTIKLGPNGAPTEQQATQGDRSVSMWFYANEANTGDKQVVYEEGNKRQGLNVYLEDGLLHSGTWNRQSGQQSGQQSSSWKGAWIESTQGQIASGQWHHVALVLEGTETAGNGSLTTYLDGKEIGSALSSQLGQQLSGMGVGSVAGTTLFEDGSVGGDSSYGLNGRVNRIATFDDALSTQQVRSLVG